MSALIVRAGLDFERPQFTPESIGDRARRELPNRPLPELDEHDEGPEAPVRRMCSEALGVQLLFSAEERGGVDGAAPDVYRVCERRREPGWVMAVAPRAAPGPAPGASRQVAGWERPRGRGGGGGPPRLPRPPLYELRRGGHREHRRIRHQRAAECP